MGLDMYLNKGNSEFFYWRKANAIHNFFVNNVQDGVDDCGTYHVPLEAFEELSERLHRIVDPITALYPEINIHESEEFMRIIDDLVTNIASAKILEICKEVLPTTAGFFFGSTDYDRWYFADVFQTMEVVDRILDEEYDEDFSYHASW